MVDEGSAAVVRVEGDLLVVSHGVRLPAVCVRCGGRDGVARRLEVMRVRRPHWLALLVSVIVVAALSLLLYVPEPWMWPFYAGGIVVVGALLHRTVGVALPVCAACDARGRRVARSVSATTLSLLPASLLAMGALVAAARGTVSPAVGNAVALATWLGWAALFALARIRAAREPFVRATAMTSALLFLKGVHPDARRELVAEAAAVRK